MKKIRINGQLVGPEDNIFSVIADMDGFLALQALDYWQQIFHTEVKETKAEAIERLTRFLVGRPATQVCSMFAYDEADSKPDLLVITDFNTGLINEIVHDFGDLDKTQWRGRYTMRVNVSDVAVMNRLKTSAAKWLPGARVRVRIQEVIDAGLDPKSPWIYEFNESHTQNRSNSLQSFQRILTRIRDLTR